MSRTLHHRGGPLAFDVRGGGPAVLFIQGVGVHGAGWAPQVDELSRHFTCLSFDNRGLGGSVPHGEALTVEAMADDARAVMDAAGWEAAHVVGHSLGGLIAQRLALDHRRRVRSLSLLCTFADGKAVAPMTPRMIWLGMRTKLGTRAMRRRAFLQFILPPGRPATVQPDDVAGLFGHDLVTLPAVVPRQLQSMRAENVLPRLSGLTDLPTLVLSARHDPLAPPALGRAIAAAIPGAAFHEYTDASHGLPITHAKDVNERLTAFMSRIGGTGC